MVVSRIVEILMKQSVKNIPNPDPFRLRPKNDPAFGAGPEPHVFRKHVCITDSRGFATHRNLDRHEVRVEATDGFIPLWAENVTLRWRFQDRGFKQHFAEPEAAKAAVKTLFGEAVDAWGDSCPVRFVQADSRTDFEIVMRTGDDCDPHGCTLASAFFPDGGRHEFAIYPKLFGETRGEQVETLVHEIGHIFGLRHFFANVKETAWPSRLFGRDNPLSIMNYDSMSQLTDDDKLDLKRLYAAARSGELKEIDGAPVRLVHPFSAIGGSVTAVVGVAAVTPIPPANAATVQVAERVNDCETPA